VLGVGVHEIPAVEEAQKTPYETGGFERYNVSEFSAGSSYRLE
jgi:hypothetical protein